MARTSAPSLAVAADIGGTHARFLLVRLDEPLADPVAERALPVANFAAFADALDAFLEGSEPIEGPISTAAFAIAGPVQGRRARLTNAPWTIDADEIAGTFGIRSVALLNDFEAAANGIEHLSASASVELQRGQAMADRPRLVIGAGTGLGVAYAIPERDGLRVIAGEGGHVGFAPRDREQIALLEFFQPTLGRVSAEHFVSGAGIARLYAFALRQLGTGRELHPDVEAEGAAAVTRLAAAGDPAARRAIELFCSIFGAVAGDHALSVLAMGGVFLAGGIAPKLEQALREPRFLDAFRAKGAHTVLMERMPVALVREERLGLIGAANAAARAARAGTNDAGGVQ
jgi:glucokinase